ncbi:response regulator [Salidesulfovibrio onnuriiensis]|uniref:response regulator n=1 Tax=Salidesulfovibrio onnuriiensis TaxID=2583823 RepID=UPI0011C7DF63|nr:response regulator transcription factor [Salidesulfovibrio onnuriiensis]
MRVMIVDDHPLLREGLKAIVNQTGRFSVAAEAGTGKEALAVALEQRPDVILMDISMPDMNGIQIIRELGRELPGTRFLVISMHSEADYIVEAFRAGANGYMIKESAAENLVRGLETVAGGGRFLDSALSGEVLDRLMSSGGQYGDVLSSLTTRERQVMRHVIEGLHTKDIARELYISPKTVENHRANMMRKLGFSNTVDLLRFAARTGLIDLSSWSA